MPIIPGIQEAKIGELKFKTSPGKKLVILYLNKSDWHGYACLESQLHGRQRKEDLGLRPALAKS
jgi:hypothetical protein